MTGLIVFCSLVFAAGIVLGELTGEWWADRRARRDEREDRADREAGEWVAELRAERSWRPRAGIIMPPEPAFAVRDERVSRRQNRCTSIAAFLDPPEVAHERRPRRTSTAAFLNPPPRSYGGKVHDIHGEAGQDCWCGYIGRDYARALPPGRLAAEFDVDAEIAAMHDRVSDFLANVVDKYRPLYPETGQ